MGWAIWLGGVAGLTGGISGGVTGGTVLLSCCVWSVMGLDVSVLLVCIGGLVVLLVASILLVTDSLSVSVLPVRL